MLEKTSVVYTLPPPPYTVRGVVRNGRGALVPGAVLVHIDRYSLLPLSSATLSMRVE